MEGIEYTSDNDDNDMSYEFTGPAIVVPFDNKSFNPSFKRTFHTFSDDSTFQPAEQDDRPAINASIAQHIPTITTINTDGLGQQQEFSWVKWGILRSFQAIQFTSILLQAVYAVTVAAAVPAKRRFVTIAQHIPAPAPVRRVLSSRRPLPRLFRQNRSPSTGQRSTSPIAPPRFRPTPLSPFHVPGTYPASPAKTPSNIPVTSTPPRLNHTPDANDSPNDAANAFVHTTDSAATNPAEDATVLEDIVDGSVPLSDDEDTDESWSPVSEPLSPLKVSTDLPVLSAHQLASINELQSIQKMSQADSPAHVPTRHIVPDSLTPTTATSSSENSSVKQYRTLRGLAESMRSPPQNLGLHGSANDGSIESTRSPPQNLGLHTENGGLIESTRSPPQNLGLHGSENDESIESTRSSSDIVSHESSGSEVSIPLSDSSRQQEKLTTILKASTSDTPGKGLISQFLANLKKQRKARASPLREIFSKANRMPKTPINKSARFLENPVTMTRKYVKGEAMSYPSAHSSRDGSSILSRTPSLVVSDLSPTQQEQEAMMADQLLGCTSSPFPQNLGAGSPEWHIALDSSPAMKNEDSGSSYSGLDGSLQSSPAQDDHSDQVHATSAKAEDAESLTPPQNLTNRFKELNVSARRSSRRTREKDDLAEKRRLEAEAIAAEEKARKDKAAAEEKARKDKEEAEEKARKYKEEAEEKARKERVEAEEKARKEQAEAEEKARKQAEEDKERDNKKLRMPIGKVIQPLSQEWENKIAAAMALAQTKTVGHTSGGTPITRRDIGKVLPQRGAGDPANGWLNDTIIDAYLQAVVDHGNEAAGHKRGETAKFHAFSNFFYNNLKDKGADNVKRWAKRAKIGGKDLLKVEWVFIPINLHGNHWTLIAVSPTRRTIEYYDSFHGRVTHQVNNIKAWLKSELGSDYKEAEWRVVEDPAAPGMGKGPQQLNGSDCGVFTVTTAKMISLGVDPMAYSASDMPTQRKRLVAELIHGGFTDEFKPDIEFA